MNQEAVRLFHISDRPGIKRFEPTPAPHPGAGVKGPGVWAIDHEHLPNYLLPRDCPRVTFCAGKETDPADLERFMGWTTAGRIIAVEARWLPAIREERLWQYEFDPEGFSPLDDQAGYYISREPMIPIAESEIGDMLGALLEHNVALWIMPSLWKLREAVIHSTLSFSIIRMRNAQPPPEGFEAYHPLP